MALHPIDFTVEEGEVLAFLGPNGAGKSTTIKMLTGILHPTSGYAEVLGYCPWKERQKLAYRVGSVFGQKSQLWYHLPPADSFELMSRIYEIGRNDYRKRRDELIERLGLSPYLLVPVRKLSLGERMRCELTAALLHRPRLLFLDEPTIGLDVIAKHKIREAIREMNREEGTTIFITSHDAGDVEQLCSRAIVINDGRIILDDRVSVMKREYLTVKRITLELREGSDTRQMKLTEHESGQSEYGPEGEFCDESRRKSEHQSEHDSEHESENEPEHKSKHKSEHESDPSQRESEHESGQSEYGPEGEFYDESRHKSEHQSEHDSELESENKFKNESENGSGRFVGKTRIESDISMRPSDRVKHIVDQTEGDSLLEKGRANWSDTMESPTMQIYSRPFELPGVEWVEQEGKRLRLDIRTQIISVEEVLGHIIRHYELEDVTIEDPPMEEVISHIYERSGKEAG